MSIPGNFHKKSLRTVIIPDGEKVFPPYNQGHDKEIPSLS
jgi:hypothetical protein